MVDIDKIVDNIRKKVKDAKGAIGIVLGHCFSDFLEYVENKVEVSFKDVNIKVLGPDEKENRFVFGSLYNKNVIIVIGRIHYSYGYEYEDVATPIYVLKELGCQNLILCSSVGAINHRIKVGDVTTLTDHLNFTGRNPLNGLDVRRYGHKFVDMVDPYDWGMIKTLEETAKREMSIKIKKGVLVEFTGPSAETASETRFAQYIGADLVGFNICNEVIAAKYCELPVLSYSLVTNHASAFSSTKVKHEDIVYNRKCASNYFLELLARFVKNL